MQKMKTLMLNNTEDSTNKVAILVTFLYIMH